MEERNGWTGRQNEKLGVISISVVGGITAESEGEDWMRVLQRNRDDLPEISLLPFKPQACKESTVAFSVCLSSVLLLFVVAVLSCLLLNEGGITVERSICNCLCDGFICTFGKSLNVVRENVLLSLQKASTHKSSVYCIAVATPTLVKYQQQQKTFVCTVFFSRAILSFC